MLTVGAIKVCVFPEAGVPVGVPALKVVLLAVIAFIAIVLPTVAPQGISAVIKI